MFQISSDNMSYTMVEVAIYNGRSCNIQWKLQYTMIEVAEVTRVGRVIREIIALLLLPNNP